MKELALILKYVSIIIAKIPPAGGSTGLPLAVARGSAYRGKSEWPVWVAACSPQSPAGALGALAGPALILARDVTLPGA